MIDTTLPAFVLAMTPGINFLGIESLMLEKCEGLGAWPNRIKKTKWTCLGLLVLLFIVASNVYKLESRETKDTIFNGLKGGAVLTSSVLGISCFFSFAMALGALTNSNYC